MRIIFVLRGMVGYVDWFQFWKIWSAVSSSATNARMLTFNIPNESEWHHDDDRTSYCETMAIINGNVGLGSWDGGPNIRKKV